MMKSIDLEARQELFFQVGDEPVKLELRRGLAEVYGTELLASKTYTFPRSSKASVFTFHGATIEITGTPLRSQIIKNRDHMTCYMSIHRDLEKMRDEAEMLASALEATAAASAAAAAAATVATAAAAVATAATTTTTTVATESSTTSATTPSTITVPSQDCDDIAGDSTSASKPKFDLSKTPICLVTEPLEHRNVGKSLICRILLNYATRRGRAPIFVDLDPDQGLIGLPGTIGALSIESPIDIETGLQLRSSMLLHYGHTSLSAGEEGKSGLYYKAIVDNMAKIVHSKLEQDKKSYFSGVIINTSSWTDNSDSSYKILLEACKSFKANIVLVVMDAFLQGDLQKDLADSQIPVRVIKVPEIFEMYRTRPTEKFEFRFSKIREYFYGTELESFNPMTSEMKFSYLKRLIYRISNPLVLSDSLMPLGRAPQEVQVRVSHFDCKASDLLHHILAVSYAQIDDVVERPEIVLSANIMGFICITSVRGDGEIVSILTPQKLPNPLDHVLLYSDVQYMDSLI